MRFRTLAGTLGLTILMLAIIGAVNAALTDPKVEWTIEPEGNEAAVIPPTSQTDSIGIEVTSDIPVDIYILDQNQYYIYASSQVISDYEKKYEGKTSLDLDYEYPDQTPRYLIVINPSSSQTAEVTLEYKIMEEIILMLLLLRKKIKQKNYFLVQEDKLIHALERPFEWLLQKFVTQRYLVITKVFPSLIDLKNLCYVNHLIANTLPR